MARRQAQSQEDTEDEINMTPMLDIVFIMLIFFIVTSSFIRETGIDPLRPEAETAVEQARGNILIGVSPAGEIWMNQENIELGQVRPMVEDMLSQNPESTVVVVSDETARTGTVIEVMDEVRRAGVQDIAIATEGGGGQL
ncbi:biopolymer transport protein ExbD [Natronospira proteinivora]|uniref:Biopolymer transport protein ExbD n=1 Tax=Natronospira proteinivora TaxID=1807133 RepID=A0ABT1G838_9GAMM|nr:biopolymer transporter ExbD [Natronospira proteinivora]MCP1726142.1 biopolymer transport protein ExbD [Natronospira proteinivora]